MSVNRNSNPARHPPRRNLVRDVLHISIQGKKPLPPSIDVFRLRQFFSEFSNDIKGVVIISSPDLGSVGKITFASTRVAATAQKTLHGSKLSDGTGLNVRFWRQEDVESQPLMTPGAFLPYSTPAVHSPTQELTQAFAPPQQGAYLPTTHSVPNLDSKEARTLYIRMSKSQFVNAEPVTKKDLWMHFDQFKDYIESISRIHNGPNGDFAFLNFTRREVASNAIRWLNNSSICGRNLHVSFKKPKNDAAATKEPIIETRDVWPGQYTRSNSQPTLPHTTVNSQLKENVAPNHASKSDTVLGHAQLVLQPFFEPICASSEIKEYKKSLWQRHKAGVEVCCCNSTPDASSIASQAFLRVSTTHVMSIKIIVGSLSTETVDAIVVPTERAAVPSMYPIAIEGLPFLKVSLNGSVSKNLFNHSTPLVEIGQSACLKAEHLPSSNILQVLFPLCEQKSAGSASLDDSIKNCIALATQMGFGSVSFPGITTKMVGSLVACVSGLASTTLHTVSVVLGTLTEAKQYIAALDALVTNSAGSGNGKPGASLSATALSTSYPHSSSNSEFVWSWSEDDGSLIPYSPAVTKQLNDSYSLGSSTCDVTINSTAYRINFQTMKQMNRLTKNERVIQRKLSRSDRSGVTWKYRDDSGGFSPYSHSHSAQIEAMCQKKDEFTYIVISKRTYRFDFNRMKQINVMTGYERDICFDHGTMETAKPSKPVFLSNGEVIVNISAPFQNITAAKKALDTKLKTLLFSKTIPYPSTPSQPLLSKIQDIAKKCSVQCTVGEGGESGASNASKQVLTIQGLQELVSKAQTDIQSLIIEFHATMAELPRPDQPANLLPPEWEHMKPQEQVKYINLSPSSPQFLRVQKRFEETVDKSNWIISKIEQVQNKYLWTRYTQSKARLLTKDPLMVNEKELFHGTRNNPAKMICSSEEGFDMRFSREGMWGQANYFAVKARYSESYAYNDTATQTNEMILAKVLTGDSYSCGPDSSLRMPPLKKQHGQAGEGELQQVRYDSVNGETHGSQVYMTYSNDLAYPAFVITYYSVYITPYLAPQPSWQPSPQQPPQPVQPPSRSPPQVPRQTVQPVQPSQPSWQQPQQPQLLFTRRPQPQPSFQRTSDKSSCVIS